MLISGREPVCELLRVRVFIRGVKQPRQAAKAVKAACARYITASPAMGAGTRPP